MCDVSDHIDTYDGRKLEEMPIMANINNVPRTCTPYHNTTIPQLNVRSITNFYVRLFDVDTPD